MASATKSMSMESMEAEENPHVESFTEDQMQQQQEQEQQQQQQIVNAEDKNELNNEDDKQCEQAEDDEIRRGPVYNCLVYCHCRCLARFVNHWPRVSSFLLGVLIPLWALIALSFIFGTWLATVESPQEIENNDAVMAHTAKLDLAANLFADISSVALVLCLWNGTQDPKLVEFNNFLHLSNNTVNNETALEEILVQAQEFNLTTNVTDKDIYINVTAETFMECHESVQNLTLLMFGALARHTASLDDPTFNWNRCSDEVNGTILYPNLGFTVEDSYKPEAQKQHYAVAWIEDRDRIFNELKEQNPNTTTVKAELVMFIVACDQATGSESCHPNSMASTWFWFTIMTTMGYGNQSPSTSAGRTMVYTFGFICLLCYGVVLVYAGFVISSIVDDAFRKTKLDFLLNNWVSSLMWGCFSYTWMLVIAQVYVVWRFDRLGDDIRFADGYWFAYISTTTIGLGDFYLEPEVITGSDLVVFPFIILIGFVFFSAFLGKLGELVSRKDELPNETLQERLEQTRIFLCCCCRRRGPPS